MINENTTVEQADDEYIDLTLKERSGIELTTEEKMRMLELNDFIIQKGKDIYPDEVKDRLDELLTELEEIIRMFDDKTVSAENIKIKSQSIFKKENEFIKLLKEKHESN